MAKQFHNYRAGKSKGNTPRKPNATGRGANTEQLENSLHAAALRGATKRTEYLHGQWVEVTVLKPFVPIESRPAARPRGGESFHGTEHGSRAGVRPTDTDRGGQRN